MKVKLALIAMGASMIYSCNKSTNVEYILDDFLLAGNNAGIGIHYVDIDPDINVEIENAWVDYDTLVDLDLNNDGIIDFKIKRLECSPSLLGADCDKIHILPIGDNEVGLDITTGWLDTLSNNDTINIDNTWSSDTLTIYGYGKIMGELPNYFGNWGNVNLLEKYYIGVKVRKDNKDFYGWIGTKANTQITDFEFYITDYAILKEYPI